IDPVSAEAYTFTTSSFGGRGAVADLGDQIARVRFSQPGAVPIVELRSAPMMTKFGKRSRPMFKVVGWKGGEAAPNGNGGGVAKYLEVKNRAPAGVGAALNDEIPW